MNFKDIHSMTTSQLEDYRADLAFQLSIAQGAGQLSMFSNKITEIDRMLQQS